MTQLKQFICWQLRDFGRVFKNLTIGGVFALVLGAQVGHVVYHLLSTGTIPQDCVVMYTIPITLLITAIAWMIEIQWSRFRREQEQIVNTLKDSK